MVNPTPQPGRTPTTAQPPRSWDDLIRSSNGQLIRFPQSLIDAVKEWAKERTEFNKKVQELGRAEHHLNHKVEAFLFEMRKYLDENKVEGAWSADIGVNMDALKDGEYILNIIQNNPGQPPQR